MNRGIGTLVAIAAVAIAVSLMHGEAHAQTEVRIGVLTSHPDDIDAGPLLAMEIAQRDLNLEYKAIDTTILLEVIDVSDFFNGTSVALKIGAALQQGFLHFIAPSDEAALGFVKGVTDQIAPDSILISPRSSTVVDQLYYDDDNLFRLAPNNNELAWATIPIYDKFGTDHIIMVIDAARGSAPFPAPEPVSERFGTPFEPLLVYSEDTPGSAGLNLQAVTDLNERLGALISQHGQDSVAVHYVSDVAHYRALLNVINANPDLQHVRNVMWYATEALLLAEVEDDPAMASFAKSVSMTILAYEIIETDTVRELKALPNPSRLHNVYANYAAYDAVHLLASSIALAGVENPPLKRVIFEVSDGIHLVEHTTRLLGEGALGDYSLDRETGDLLVGVGNFNEHRIVQNADGSYKWVDIIQRVCR